MIDEITIDELDNNNILYKKQIFSLYFNKIDLAVVKELNIDDNNTLCFTTIKETIEKYNYNLLDEISSRLDEQNNKYGKNLLFLGETYGVDFHEPQPVFMDDWGNIIDFIGNEYHVSNRFIEKDVNDKTIKMFLLTTSLTDETLELGKKLITEKGNDDTPINEREMVQKILNLKNKGVNEELEYEFERLRLSEDQIKQIKLNCFDYEVIKNLNTDTKITHKRYQFGYHPIENIKKAKRANNIDEYKFCLLVGFTKDIIDGSRKPVYLKRNSWFSDTYANYWPNYRTIRITEDLLLKTFGEDWELTHSNLLNKISYEFIYGVETVDAINYNDWFTGNYWQKILKVVVVPLGVTVVVVAGSFVLPYLGTFFVSGFYNSAAVAAGAAGFQSASIVTASQSTGALGLYALSGLGSKALSGTVSGILSNANVGVGGNKKIIRNNKIRNDKIIKKTKRKKIINRYKNKTKRNKKIQENKKYTKTKNRIIKKVILHNTKKLLTL